MKERLLTNIEPVQVFKYFEDLTFIPRESGNEKGVSDYLVAFAKQQRLEWMQDDALNVIIIKPASAGYENHPGVIMQAHMDMVCSKKLWSDIDFEHDPICFEIQGDKIISEETSLGADDGIGVALILALLADRSLKHPQIEAVFTTEEETGLFGVEKIDFNELDGEYVISLDAADEGVAVIGCAGGPVICSKIPVSRMDADSSLNYYKLKIQGLLGGHSGEDIHRGRAHANKLMARVLMDIWETFGDSDRAAASGGTAPTQTADSCAACDFVLASFRGGDKSNSISRTAEAVIGIRPGYTDDCRTGRRKGIAADTPMTLELMDNETRVQQIIEKYAAIFRDEYRVNDPEVLLTWEKLGGAEAQAAQPEQSESAAQAAQQIPAQMLDGASAQKILGYIDLADSGIVRMDEDFPHLVESSVNLGAVRIRPEHAEFWHVVRSSRESQAEMMADKIYRITELLGGKYTIPAGSPPWQADPDSRIREAYVKVYENLFDMTPEMMVLHAALEPCKIAPRADRKLDMIALGPDVRNLHAPGEYLTISSTQRLWETLKALLAEL